MSNGDTFFSGILTGVAMTLFALVFVLSIIEKPSDVIKKEAIERGHAHWDIDKEFVWSEGKRLK